ncbi:CGNR zinc finger domain-containing protein [Stackebrandtia nassauensis]|uniref:Zinc finger CGNR domain-containing protein n=1 Tax=Stackebrandtia nassauensis (strain DSM 44728 / CIP 108903 / NRRL B-16338 / NBRC 102104 / LLR-40K-21) TaxID=446470 RepID=D3Q6L6_STANL|nr:CGNR zinc finger domain-containing protein [Stackebrandtia nassauensis]ADD44259.1 protein of unknown function DUF1470 [Stackebrandtia nassauensis DSM 44728]
MNFNSHTDAVVAVSVELVNLLTSGYKQGRPYSPPQDEDQKVAIATVLSARKRDRHLLTATETTEIQALAQRLRPIFTAVSLADHDDAAERVNALLRDTAAHPLLIKHDGEPWHIHFHGDRDSYTNDWAAGCATGLAIVLGSEHADRLGECTAPACDRVFVDTSRNGTRRFCSTSCQNRVKTAAFRAREKARK